MKTDKNKEKLDKFKEKYGVWLFIGGLILIIVFLKLIGFPEILMK